MNAYWLFLIVLLIAVLRSDSFDRAAKDNDKLKKVVIVCMLGVCAICLIAWVAVVLSKASGIV